MDKILRYVIGSLAMKERGAALILARESSLDASNLGLAASCMIKLSRFSAMANSTSELEWGDHFSLLLFLTSSAACVRRPYLLYIRSWSLSWLRSN